MWRLSHGLFPSCRGGGGLEVVLAGVGGGVRGGEPGMGGVIRIGPLVPPTPPLSTRAGSRVL